MPRNVQSSRGHGARVSESVGMLRAAGNRAVAATGGRCLPYVVARQRGAGNRAITTALLQRMTLKQAVDMKGLAIRVDNSGQNSLEGAAYLLAPDATALALGGDVPTTAEWKRTLLTTARFILGFELGPETKLLFLSGSFGGTGGTYAKALGGTFEKVPSVRTAKVEKDTLISNRDSAESLVRWVVRQVEQRVGTLEDDGEPTVSSSPVLTSSAESSPAALTTIPANNRVTASTSSSTAAGSVKTAVMDVASIADAVAAREADRDDKNTDDLKWQDYSDLGATAGNWDLVCEALQRKPPGEDGARWYGLL